eukprot:IDg7378t1
MQGHKLCSAGSSISPLSQTLIERFWIQYHAAAAVLKKGNSIEMPDCATAERRAAFADAPSRVKALTLWGPAQRLMTARPSWSCRRSTLQATKPPRPCSAPARPEATSIPISQCWECALPKTARELLARAHNFQILLARLPGPS